MVDAKWGLKRVCLSCGARYYDMKKNPPVCPSCGTTFDDSVTKSRRGRVAEEKARKAAPAPEEIDDLPDMEDDGDDVIIEDVAELGEDEVDVDDVVVLKKDSDGVGE